MKKWISWLLVIGAVVALLIPSALAEEKPVTRMEWIKNLVDTFGMTVEENNYPDNYYSDIADAADGYCELMAAVEFGVIDLEAGCAFEPNQPATREFAAHTLNFCLGFQLNQGVAYTYAEFAEVSYSDDLQVAVNRGWFALQDGKILPQQALTSTEATAMLKDAAAVMNLSTVSENYNSVYKFQDGVIVIQDGTDISVQNDSVTIKDCPVSIQPGDLFVVYQNEIPVGYRATSAMVNGLKTTIAAVRADDGVIFKNVDAQGVIEADLNNVTPLDGSDIGYYVKNLDKEFETYAQARAAAQGSGTVKPKVELTVKRTVTLGNGVKLSIDAKAKNAVIRYNVNAAKGIAFAKLEFDFELHHVVKCDLAGAMQSDEVKLFLWGIPGIGGATFSVEMAAAMSSDAIQKWHVSQEIAFSTADGIRFTPRIDKKDFTLSTEGTAKLGVAVKFGITEMPVIKGYSYLQAGATCKLQQKTYDGTDAPFKCVHFAAYLYADAGLEASAKFFNYKKTFRANYPLLDEKNSPVRIVTHYEDGKSVPKCTHGDVESWFGGGFRGYYTPGDSRYGSSGWASGFGGTGYDRNGNPIVIYTYSLDDENASITSYKGNATSLIIPSKLDGYTVVAIGDGAFEGNTLLTAVTIPDTVVTIEEGAFSGCTGLTDIKLSRNLKTLGSDAFYGCNGLTSVSIPKTVENTHFYYNGVYSPFRGCNSLQVVEFEDGMTRIPNSILCYCAAKLNIVIPDSVTEIGESAFLNSGLLSVTIPDTVVTIEEGAFSGCTGLTDIKLSRNLKTLGSDAFYGCNGLTSVSIPKTVENTHFYYNGVYSPFRGCNSLQVVEFEDGMTRIPNSILCYCAAKLNIVIPDSVTEIGESAFFNSGLLSVTIPDTVVTIEEGAFSGCTELTNVKVPDSVTSMGESIFQNCIGLTDVILPGAWGVIPASTFEGCIALEKLVLPESVKNIQSCAFKNCTALKELVWSKAPEAIESNAFYNCDAIAEIDIPATVTSVGSQAFYDCDGLTRVTIPDSVTSLGNSVFYDCDALTEVKLGTGITDIPASAFRHCDILEQVAVPRRVTVIKDSAFKDSVKFSAITIPRSVTSIATTAFSYPDKLTIYGVAGTYAEAFANANSITFVDRQIPATSVSLNQTIVTLNKGASGQLNLTAAPENFTDAAVWKSSNTSVATVSDTGMVRAVGVGTATIKVSVGTVSASCKVTVLQPVTSISLNRTSFTLNALDTYRLQATVYPLSAADHRIQWSSSDPDVAMVDENGNVTANKKGTVSITATAMDGSGVKRSCQITVSNTAYICTAPEQMESPHDYSDKCTDIWLYTKPGAKLLRVTFDEQTCVEDGFDYVYIFDGAGTQTGRYTGTELAGVTITIPGDTIKIQMSSDDSGNDWGFKITKIESVINTFIYGDLNEDSVVNMKDLGVLRKYLAGGYGAEKIIIEAADLNSDSVVNMKDLGVLRRYLAGGYDAALGR